MLKPDKIGILLQWFGTIKELQTNQVGNFFDSMTALPQSWAKQSYYQKNSKPKLCKEFLKICKLNIRKMFYIDVTSKHHERRDTLMYDLFVLKSDEKIIDSNRGKNY